MIKYTTIAMSKMPPTTPPAIAAMLGAMGVLEDGTGVAIALSVTTASPTANVEKWVTTKEHLHFPLCTTPLHRDMASGAEKEFPLLASDTANPCATHNRPASFKAHSSKHAAAHLHV
jgi:hypothetical protein